MHVSDLSDLRRDAQVRTLMEHVDSLCLQRQKRSGRRAAAVVCGDFNSAAGALSVGWVSTMQAKPHAQC